MEQIDIKDYKNTKKIIVRLKNQDTFYLLFFTYYKK